jgi:hypothetical protein
MLELNVSFNQELTYPRSHGYPMKVSLKLNEWRGSIQMSQPRYGDLEERFTNLAALPVNLSLHQLEKIGRCFFPRIPKAEINKSAYKFASSANTNR